MNKELFKELTQPERGSIRFAILGGYPDVVFMLIGPVDFHRICRVPGKKPGKPATGAAVKRFADTCQMIATGTYDLPVDIRGKTIPEVAQFIRSAVGA